MKFFDLDAALNSIKSDDPANVAILLKKADYASESNELLEQSPSLNPAKPIDSSANLAMISTSYAPAKNRELECNQTINADLAKIADLAGGERLAATVPDVTDTDLQRLPPWKRHLVKVHNRATFITMADGSTWEVATAEVLRHAIAADYSDLLNTLVYRAFATLLIEDRLVEAYPLWTPRIVQCQACAHAGPYPHNPTNMVACAQGWGWVNPLNARWKTDWIQCPDYAETVSDTRNTQEVQS